MAFNGSGTFNALTSPKFPAVSGQVISASYYNDVINDLVSGMNTAFCRDGQATATADLNLGGFKLLNVADGNASGDAVNFGQLDLKAPKDVPVFTGDVTLSTGHLQVNNGGDIFINGGSTYITRASSNKWRIVNWNAGGDTDAYRIMDAVGNISFKLTQGSGVGTYGTASIPGELVVNGVSAIADTALGSNYFRAKFFSGLRMMAGVGTVSGGAGQFSVTFASAFGTAAIGVVITGMSDRMDLGTAYNLTTTGFTARCTNVSDNSYASDGHTFNWLAFGY